MSDISFTWTTAAFRALCKDVTRREWEDDYGARFWKGQVVTALDRTRRYGGKEIGKIRLLEKPYKEPEGKMPDRDYYGEGFAFFDRFPQHKPKAWAGVDLRTKFEIDRQMNTPVWVIRFEILEVVTTFVFDDQTPEAEVLRLRDFLKEPWR